MDKNEIKKALYKEKPEANFISATKDGLIYRTMVGGEGVTFLIPLNDMSSAIFTRIVEAHLMIRWIIETE